MNQLGMLLHDQPEWQSTEAPVDQAALAALALESFGPQLAQVPKRVQAALVAELLLEQEQQGGAGGVPCT